MESNPQLTAGYTVYMIDTQADPEFAKRYKVRSVPTLVVLGDKQKELRRTTGYTTESSLREWLDKQHRRRSWRRK